MARGNFKFPVEKPYLKVPRSYTSTNTSSSGKPDLSYSYSCVKDFKKNQHIIGQLATLHREQNYQGNTYQPELYTLSGERQKPLCKPFYYSTLSESDERGKSEYNQDYYDVDELRKDFQQEIQSDTEPDFPDTNLLLQWIKYQFKYVNILRPFSRYKDNFVSKLCKKNRKMKMEMLLNNIDEETKCRLKKYVNDLNLSIEERFSLCNESVIEIDITPIVEDPHRLKDFLVFLNTLESSNPKEVKSEIHHNQKGKSLENKVIFENNNLFTKPITDECNLFQTNKNSFKKTLGDKNDHHFDGNTCHKQQNKIINAILKTPNTDYLDFTSNKRNLETYTKHFNNNGYCSPQELTTVVSFPYPPKNHKFYNSEMNSEKEPIIENIRAPLINRHHKELYPKPDSSKKARFNSTIPTAKHIEFDKTIDSYYLTKVQEKDYKLCAHAEHSNYKEQKWNEPYQIRSCNCTMHHRKHNIYNNQCVYVEGDNNGNKFTKYITVKNKISESKLYSFKFHSNKKLHKAETTTIDYKQSNNKNTSGVSINHTSSNKNPALQTMSYKYLDSGSQVNNSPKLTCLNNIHCSNNESKLSSTKLDMKGIRSQPYMTKNLRSRINSNKLSLDGDNKSKCPRGVINSELNTVFKASSSNFENSSTTESITGYIADRNSSVSDLHDSTCRLVRVEDVEKLVRAINYSEHSFSHQSLCNKKEVNKKKKVKSDNYKQISINACFESVDYSINSLVCNTADTANSLYLKQTGSSSFISSNKYFDNKGLSDLRLPFDSVGQRKDDIVEKQSKNVMKHVFHSSLFSKYENVPQDHERNSATKYCIKNHDSLSTGGKEVEEMGEKQKKLSEIVNNIQDLQKKMSHLNERLTLLNNNQTTFGAKDLYKCNNSNSPLNSTPKKMSLVIQIDSNDTEMNKIINQRASRKHQILNSFKPKNIYRSISTIFKGTIRKYTISKTNNIKDKNSNNNNFEEDTNTSENSCNSHCKYILVNNASSAESSQENDNASQHIEPPLTLKNLEQLYLELRNQRSEINNMKDHLKQSDQLRMFKK